MFLRTSLGITFLISALTSHFTQIVFHVYRRDDLFKLLNLITNNAARNFNVRVFNIKYAHYNYSNYEETKMFEMDVKELREHKELLNKHKQDIRNYERVDSDTTGYYLFWC